MEVKPLNFKATKKPDMSGVVFVVEAGKELDIQSFSDWAGLFWRNIDQEHVKSAQDAAAQLNPGEYLELSL